MHNVLREESAQSTVEYAIVTVALLSIVLAIAGLCALAPMDAWRHWSSGSVSWRRPIVGYRCRDGCQGHRSVLISRVRTGHSLRSRPPFCCRRF